MTALLVVVTMTTAGWALAPLVGRRPISAVRAASAPRLGRTVRFSALARHRSPPPHRVLPQALELTLVVLGSGGSLVAAIRILAEHSDEPIASAAAIATAEVRNGRSLSAALHGLQTELGPQYESLTGALGRAAARGGSLTSTLDRLAVEAALVRRRAGERRARRLPVVLLGPLVGVSLPAVLIGSFLPVAIVALRGLGP
ncbi:MAG: type II secretion system F family protein [Actinomycetota bacterium]